MILSHRIGLTLLDRENRDASSGRDADRRFDVLGGRVSRELDKLAALAARLTRLGARDLPLPAGLHRLDLPPAAQAVADTAWPVSTGSAPLSSPQAAMLASLRTNRDPLAAVPVPARAHEVAVSGPTSRQRAVAAAASAARARVARPFLPAADQETRRTRNAVMAVFPRSVPTRRDAAGPTSRQRAPLATVETAVAARRGDRSAPGGQDRRPTVPAVSLALRAAGRAAGSGKTLSSIAAQSSSLDVAPSTERPGPVRRAGTDILHAAVPEAAGREVLGGLASSSAVRSLPPGMPEAGSKGDTQHRLADLQRGVVSFPQAESRQDVLRRQVISPAGISGRSAALPIGSVTQGDVGSRQVAAPGAVAEEGSGVEAGKMMVNLMGDVVVDGQRLGRVVASSQARQASLPAHGPSRVNLRVVPIHSGMQIPQ